MRGASDGAHTPRNTAALLVANSAKVVGSTSNASCVTRSIFDRANYLFCVLIRTGHHAFFEQILSGGQIIETPS
jgi:hypothetical protein